MADERTPPDVREGVRSGIYAALKRDVEMRGGHTARVLAAAGVVGVAGAVGLTLLVSGHPFDHHPGWHVAVFSAVWAGLLVVSLAVALLRVRTPGLPLARSASVGLLGLGVAGICGVACPDPHFLAWWSSTSVGAKLTESGGLAVSAFCFGVTASLFVAVVAAFLALGDPHRATIQPFLPAAMLVLLLLPGVALQSVGTPGGVFLGWILGTAAGCYFGVASGMRLRTMFR